MTASRNLLENLYIAKLSSLDLVIRSFPRLKYALDHHRNIRGERMRFDDKPYLLAIFCDDAARIFMMSCVQMGKTEMLMVAAFYFAEIGLQVMYVLPDLDIRNMFVANRVDTVLSKVSYYQSQLQHELMRRSTDNKGLKHFGKGSIFFASSNSQSTFIEKPLDAILADETDRFDLANYEKADDRLSASPYKIRYEASNPTVENFAIARSYEASDQRTWQVKCDGCKQWQALDWFENCVRQTGDKLADFMLRDREWYDGCGRDIMLFCRHCARPLDRLAKGEWIAKFPKREAHGYHLSQIFGAHNRVRDMYERFRKGLGDDTAMQVFYNSILGMPYAGAGAKLTDEILNRCKEPYLMPAHADGCFMGVDVGKRLHVVVRQLCPGEKLRLVWAGTVPEFEDLHKLMERFKIITFVIDAMPETRKATEFVQKYPNKGWICRYQNKLTDVSQDEQARVLSVDRTQIMDRVQSFYLRQAFILPANAQSLDRGDYYRMLKLPTRVYSQEREAYLWLGDPDHYYHAENYALLAYIVRGEFKVWGLAPRAGVHEMAPRSEEDLLKKFPPGTDPAIVEHYRRLYAQMNDPLPSDTMRGDLKGNNTNGY